MLFNASEFEYSVVCQASTSRVYPYMRTPDGCLTMDCISPHHGRSYIVAQDSKSRYIVSKGNGLSYTQYNLLNTGEFGDNTLGLLLKKDAIRDFNLGQEISSLGIKTNHMEYVLELHTDITLSNGHNLRPILLQYSVECPYRICDAAFVRRDILDKYIEKWDQFETHTHDERYLKAAEILVKNLRILHSNNILHNAIHVQNYTWALELLDFELSCSPRYPYDSEEDQKYVKDLFSREIIYTYEVINHIAWYLDEKLNYRKIDNIFQNNGFDLQIFSI